MHTHFELKYAGPDSAGRPVAIPLDKLFRDLKDDTLGAGIARASVGAEARRFLDLHYMSTLRDIRRSYLRAFKALLFVHRFGISVEMVADAPQSEIGYLLAHPEEFAGQSYFRAGGGFAVHRALFDLNFLPVRDNFFPPAQDQRAAPSVKRRQALFDWWERMFDYAWLRQEARRAFERPVWLLFHEAAEQHPDLPAQLTRHMGVDARHVPLVLRYYDGYVVSSDDLMDERWAVRVWRAETWILELLCNFAIRFIEEGRPDLWASDDPGTPAAASGNANLTRFVRDGEFENGDPRRYLAAKRLNDGLRERARAALLAFLCGMGRVPLPWGGEAHDPKHLSELLLLDVEAGLCQRASRIEEAVSAVQAVVQRARLGLEPGFAVTAGFALLWDRRFATFRVWEACKRREIYRENWIDWEELLQARRGEAFRFLEAELRRGALTIPTPGGLEYWPDQRPPAQPGLVPLQSREPALLHQLWVPPEGFDLLGTPERHARRSWLASLRGSDGILRSPDAGTYGRDDARLPFWIQAAIRLGTRFLRIAAAGLPPASSPFERRDPDHPVGCCVECGKPHPPYVDEY
jgi:hypothetical protein